MSLLPLTLGVRRVPRAKEAGENGRRKTLSASEWPRLRSQVLARDDYTCQYCGFRSRKFQHVHFKRGEMADPVAKNLTTACIFCEQCHEIESVQNMLSGLLIWLPEMSQVDLHHLCRALYVARVHEDHPYAARAQTVLDQLLARRQEAKRRLGIDDPMMLAIAMTEYLSDEDYAARTERLDGIRLLPLPRRIAFSQRGEYDQFPDILQYWVSKEGPFGRTKIDAWEKFFPNAA